MKKIFTKEVIIGLLVILALALLFGGIEFLKGVDVFEKENTYHISYENVSGLAVSAPVTVNGYKVGQVRAISYEYDNPGHVRVDIEVADELRLPKGTTAILASDLLGTATIALQLGAEAEYYNPGASIPGVIPSGMMDKVSNELLPAVSQVFPKVDTLLTGITGVVTDPNIRATLAGANAAMGSVNKLAGDLKSVTSNLTTLSNELIASANQISGILGTLPPIVSDVKTVTGSFVGTAGEVDALVRNLNTAVADVSQKLNNVPLDSLMTSLQSTVDNLQEMTGELKKDLRNPDSTLGKLMNDPALYNSLNNAVGSLDSLLIDVKKNPKRYISIKLL